jgi:hypothetical protein
MRARRVVRGQLKPYTTRTDQVAPPGASTSDDLDTLARVRRSPSIVTRAIAPRARPTAAETNDPSNCTSSSRRISIEIRYATSSVISPT